MRISRLRTNRVLPALASLLLTGCATSSVIQNHERGAPVYFGGTRLNLAALTYDVDALDRFAAYGMQPPRYPLADLPLSLAADLVLTNPITAYPGLVFAPTSR